MTGDCARVVVAILLSAALFGCGGDEESTGASPTDSPPADTRLRAVDRNAAALDSLRLIPSVVDRALAWLAGSCHHEDGSFFLPPYDDFLTWDTVLVVWLFDGLAGGGFDVSSYADEIADARAWIDAARKPDGSFTFMAPWVKGSCTETTSLAAVVAPDTATDAWLVDQQLPDGHWRYLYDFIDDPDYPSATVHPLYAAACRDLAVDRDAALAWLAAQEWEASPNWYSSRFYITYLLAAIGAARGDLPAALSARMREMLLAEQGADGSFEGRTMADDPTAVVATALALETAVALDDDALDPLVRRAALFLLRTFDGDHWRGGRYVEDHPQDVSLFATVHAVRALAMVARRVAGGSFDPCH
jgi:hypothetical protein